MRLVIDLSLWVRRRRRRWTNLNSSFIRVSHPTILLTVCLSDWLPAAFLLIIKSWPGGMDGWLDGWLAGSIAKFRAHGKIPEIITLETLNYIRVVGNYNPLQSHPFARWMERRVRRPETENAWSILNAIHDTRINLEMNLFLFPISGGSPNLNYYVHRSVHTCHVILSTVFQQPPPPNVLQDIFPI